MHWGLRYMRRQSGLWMFNVTEWFAAWFDTTDNKREKYLLSCPSKVGRKACFTVI